MTNSPTSSVPNTTSRVNHFTGLARKRRKFSLLPANGDGSTLSLDFTTGVLDPRLTFDRLSTATFINSSGLVQFANANLMTYSTPRSAGSAWGTTGTVTWGSATITDPLGNASAQEVTLGTTSSAIFNTSGTTVVSGITHTFSVWLRAASGTTNVRIGNANVAPVSTVTLTTTWQRFSCQYVASGTNDGGAVYSQTGTPSSTFYVWGAQVQPGSIVGELLETTGTLRRNTPRFDYDPTTLAPRGLLIEGSAVNYMLESTSLSGYSNSNMVAVSSGSETDPEGNANSAKQIYASATTGYHGWYRNVTAGTNTTVTVSIWAKARNYTFLFLSDLASGRAAVRFNLQTGATDNNFGAGYVSARATKYTNDWWRCEMTVSVTASVGYGWTFAGVPSTGATLNGFGAQYNGTGNAADGIYCYGFQVEGGSGASSYIPTVASQGNRAYDHCYATGANFTSWFSVGAGTMVVVSDNQKYLSGISQNLAANISDDSASNYIRMGFKVSGSANEYLLTTVGGPTSYRGAADSGYVPPLNTVYKMGYAWDTADFGIVANGGTVGTDLSGILAGAGVLNRLVVGGDFVAVPNDIYFKNGHIRSLKYWPTRLPNAQLQALTT